jgi:rod shape-determining protein MreC
LKNIFIFIHRHFNFLLFAGLQIFSIYLVVSYSKYHEAAFSELSNEYTGAINTKYYNLQKYFYLKNTNDSLIKANELLYNKLKSNYAIPDSLGKSFIDTMRLDSVAQFKKYEFIATRVVSNSISSQSNYLVLDKGTNDQLKVGMGVVDPNKSVIGIITEITDKYSVVMSLLHKDSHISGKLSKGGQTGTLSWDGSEVNAITLNNIPKSSKIFKGDTIISSGFSTALPKGMTIGYVDKLYKDPSSNYLKIKFLSAANFYNLQYAYVIRNFEQDGIQAALDKIKKQP